jgi:hypothetical protein
VYFKGKFLDREQLTKPEFIEKKCN